MLLYQILASTIYGTISKILTKTLNLKYQFQRGMKHLFYLIYSILYQIFNIIWVYLKKKHEKKSSDPSVRIYVNKIEKNNTFKVKTRYYFELLTPESMKLFGSTKSIRNYWKSISTL